MITTPIAVVGALFRVDGLLPVGQFFALATIGCAKISGIMIAGVLMAAGTEELALRRAFRASEEIATAIGAFAAVHGAPPEKLAELTPSFFVSVPGTTLAGAPTFYYRPEGKSGAWELEGHERMGCYRRGPTHGKFEYISVMGN